MFPSVKWESHKKLLTFFASHSDWTTWNWGFHSYRFSFRFTPSWFPSTAYYALLPKTKGTELFLTWLVATDDGPILISDQKREEKGLTFLCSYAQWIPGTFTAAKVRNFQINFFEKWHRVSLGWISLNESFIKFTYFFRELQLRKRYFNRSFFYFNNEISQFQGKIYDLDKKRSKLSIGVTLNLTVYFFLNQRQISLED